jgi:MFS transporter, MHS family, proline/betaine transporter
MPARSLTAAIFAGTVPYLLTLLISRRGNQMMPAFYLIVVGAGQSGDHTDDA